MWTSSYSTTVKGVDVDRLWRIWADVDAWHTWQSDLDHAKRKLVGEGVAASLEAQTQSLLARAS